MSGVTVGEVVTLPKKRQGIPRRHGDRFTVTRVGRHYVGLKSVYTRAVFVWPVSLAWKLTKAGEVTRIERAQAALHGAGYSEWETPRILNTIAEAVPEAFAP